MACGSSRSWPWLAKARAAFTSRDHYAGDLIALAGRRPCFNSPDSGAGAPWSKHRP